MINPISSHPLSSLSSALSSETLILVPLNPCFHRTFDLAHVKHSGAVKLLTEPLHDQSKFLKFLDLNSPRSVPDLVPNIPLTGKASFLELSNKLAEFIQQQSEHYLFLCLAFLLTYNFTLDFKNHPILEFQDMGNKPQDGHLMDTRCRPNITAALQGHWKGHDMHWPLI